MKLISWNCQGAFRKKAEYILALNPDILVVQECESPDRLIFNASVKTPNSSYWYSDGGKKGLGIFSYSDYKFELLPIFNPEFRYVIPFLVSGNGQEFNLLAIWAMDNKLDRRGRYIGQVWNALNHYQEILKEPIILIGDFNSNKIWDYKDRYGSHSDVVNRLAETDIHSVYHKHHEVEQGEEPHPTLYMYRKKEKPFHIDYCFVSANLFSKVKEVEIGSHEIWSSHSDHSPLSIKFDMQG